MAALLLCGIVAVGVVQRNRRRRRDFGDGGVLVVAPRDIHRQGVLIVPEADETVAALAGQREGPADPLAAAEEGRAGAPPVPPAQERMGSDDGLGGRPCSGPLEELL